MRAFLRALGYGRTMELYRGKYRIIRGPSSQPIQNPVIITGPEYDSGVVLNTDGTVSRRHLTLKVSKCHIEIRDHNTKYGTRFQGRELEGKIWVCELGAHDLQIGRNTHFKLILE
jgi:pSer/pThr/pTyr-binding forkhead associated (FHA) protein